MANNRYCSAMSHQPDPAKYWHVQRPGEVPSVEIVFGTEEQAKITACARWDIPYVSADPAVTAVPASNVERAAYNGYEERRNEAELRIAEKNGYSGFEWNGKWYCISHAIDYIWGGEFETLDEWCSTNVGDLRGRDGAMVNAWHDDSFQYLQSSDDYAEGIHCEVEECGTEIYPAADDEDDFDEEVED